MNRCADFFVLHCSFLKEQNLDLNSYLECLSVSVVTVVYKSNMTVMMCVLSDGACVSVCFAVCYWQER